MEDLTVELLEKIHAGLVAEEGGDCRVLSEANLHQLVFRANLITECVPRAAFVFYSLCAYPAFCGGNAQIALLLTEQVLASGGYRITGENAGIMALVQGILEFTTEPEDIEEWLCKNVIAIRIPVR